MQAKIPTILLAILGLSSQSTAALSQPLSLPQEDAVATAHLERLWPRIRDTVTAAARASARPPSEQPETVWRENRQLLEENLTLTSEVLRDLLDSEDPAIRALSAGLLGRVSGRTAREWLEDTTSADSEAEVRLAALDALRTASGFLEVCHLVSEFERGAEVRAMSPDIARAQAHLRNAPVKKPVRQSVPRALTSQDKTTKTFSVEEAVAEEIEEIWKIWGKEGTADEARKRLRNLGPAAVAPLTERLWKDYVYGWYISFLMLPEMGGRELIHPMSEIVRTHPERHMRVRALEILLVANGFFETWDLLEDRIEAETDPTVRQRAIAYRNACLVTDR